MPEPTPAPRMVVLSHRAIHGAFAAVTRSMAVGLAEHGVAVDVLYLEGPPPAEITDYPAGTRLIRVGGRSRTCWRAVARHLREQRPAALISLGWVLNPAAVLAVRVARTHTPLILNEASCLSYKAGVEHRAELRLRALGKLARVVYPRADVVTGVSSGVIDDLIHGIGLDARRTRLRVVPNAVDGDEVRRRAQLPDPGLVRAGAEPVFINVARHARQKNLPLLVRSFDRYRRDGGSGTLVLVGDGPTNAELRRLVTDLGLADRVLFRGRLENPFPQLAAATAFVLSSEEEGFGLVMVEAMALGVPVIATDCPGGPREVLRDGRCGLIVRNFDEPALSAAMHRLATDQTLREQLRDAGRRRAEDFSTPQIGRLWRDIAVEAGARLRTA